MNKKLVALSLLSAVSLGVPQAVAAPIKRECKWPDYKLASCSSSAAPIVPLPGSYAS